MGAVTLSLDPALLDCLLAATAAECFVETGTYQGETVARVQPHFARVISIERDAALAQAAMTRFGARSNVTIVAGTSPAVLAALSPQLATQAVIYWLDAHWYAHGDAGSLPAGEAEPCPLLAELTAIGPLHPRSTILIDDARLFLAPPVAPQPVVGWPRLHEIVSALLALSPDHRLLVVNDVLVFCPAAAEEALLAFARQQGVDWHHVYTQSIEAERIRRLYVPAQQDNVDKEAVIQQMRREHRTSLFFWLRHVWQRTIGYSKQLVQYPPRPLRLPSHYARTALQSADPPGITLVTPSYQQGVYLGRTIESVLAQGYPKLEYVIQDGGSTDTTPAILDKYRDRLARVVAARDGGQADAINRGFQGTQGAIMAWLNADDVLLPGTLAYVADYFAAHPEVDVVYGHRIQIDEHDREIGRWVLPAHDGDVLGWADYVPQETLFWRRRIWDKAGGYVDTSYRFALDWELLLRFQRAGARFVRLPRFLAAFRVHDAQKTSAQLHSIGAEEMQRLRRAWHGRPVSGLEVQSRIVGYLLRAAWLDRLVAWGIARH